MSATPRKSGYVTIGDLAEGTAVIYEQGHYDLSTNTMTVEKIKGYVGETKANIGGRDRVILMRTKTTGKRIGSVSPKASVRLR